MPHPNPPPPHPHPAQLCYQWLHLWRVYQETDLRGGGSGGGGSGSSKKAQ
jgi:hypothetical protein